MTANLVRIGDRLVMPDDINEFYAHHGKGRCIPLSDLRALWEESKKEAFLDVPSDRYVNDYIVEIFERKLRALEGKK